MKYLKKILFFAHKKHSQVKYLNKTLVNDDHHQHRLK